MRSFFCDKCHLEFDLDEDFEEGENTVFCPQCKIHLAKILPETPERMILREKRMQESRRRQLKKNGCLMAGTLIILLIFTVLLLVGSRSYFWMLAAGLLGGVPAGLWTRRITADRTFRAGILASVLFLLILAADAAVLYFCGKLILSPPLRNLAGGMAAAWIIAVWDLNS